MTVSTLRVAHAVVNSSIQAPAIACFYGIAYYSYCGGKVSSSDMQWRGCLIKGNYPLALEVGEQPQILVSQEPPIVGSHWGKIASDIVPFEVCGSGSRVLDALIESNAHAYSHT